MQPGQFPEKQKTMKNEFTFAEVSKIFAQVEKVENAVKDFENLTEEYNKVNAEFEDEFAKYNYTFYHAPQELSDMFEVKSSMMDKRDKAERKAYKTIKEFAGMIELGANYVELVEERVKKYLDSKYYWLATEMVSNVKCLALMASRKINVYA